MEKKVVLVANVAATGSGFGGPKKAFYPNSGKSLSAKLQLECKGEIFDMPPCMEPSCDCVGIYYRGVFTTTSRLRLTLNLESLSHGVALSADDEIGPFAVYVEMVSPAGECTRMSGPQLRISGEMISATTVRFYLRPDEFPKYGKAHIVVSDGTNELRVPFEIRSKPSGWVLVTGTSDIPALFRSLGCGDRCKAVHTIDATSAFVELDQRSSHTLVMAKYCESAKGLGSAAIQFILSPKKKVFNNQPFAIHSGEIIYQAHAGVRKQMPISATLAPVSSAAPTVTSSHVQSPVVHPSCITPSSSSVACSVIQPRRLQSLKPYEDLTADAFQFSYTSSVSTTTVTSHAVVSSQPQKRSRDSFESHSVESDSFASGFAGSDDDDDDSFLDFPLHPSDLDLDALDLPVTQEAKRMRSGSFVDLSSVVFDSSLSVASFGEMDPDRLFADALDFQ